MQRERSNPRVLTWDSCPADIKLIFFLLSGQGAAVELDLGTHGLCPGLVMWS